MPISEQRKIATSVKQQTSGYSLDLVKDEALERVKAGWQDRGYFRAEVSGKTKILSRNSAVERVVINAYVDEGKQYRLGEITFRNNKAIPNSAMLRGLIPIRDGDIFSREKIAKGIENLRKAYGERGYINYTGVPDTHFNDDDKIINIDFDVDEGKQFHVGTIQIVGLDERSRGEILRDFPAGEVYNQRLFRLFLQKYAGIFKMHPDDPRLSDWQLDQKAGTISITIYACPCPSCSQ